MQSSSALTSPSALLAGASACGGKGEGVGEARSPTSRARGAGTSGKGSSRSSRSSSSSSPKREWQCRSNSCSKTITRSEREGSLFSQSTSHQDQRKEHEQVHEQGQAKQPSGDSPGTSSTRCSIVGAISSSSSSSSIADTNGPRTTIRREGEALEQVPKHDTERSTPTEEEEEQLQKQKQHLSQQDTPSQSRCNKAQEEEKGQEQQERQLGGDQRSHGVEPSAFGRLHISAGTGGIMSAIRRRLNRFKEEGPLKNVLLELKQTSKSIHAVAGAHSRLLTEIEKWAHKQSKPIDEFAKDMQGPELDIVSYIQQYLRAYEDFRSFWQDILTERKEVKTALHAHHKAEKAVSSAQKHVRSTKVKEERRQRRESLKREKEGGSTTESEGSTGSTPTSSPPTQRKSLHLDMVEGDLVAKQHAEEESKEKLKERQLLIEKRIHRDLRKAYDALLKQRMEFLHSCAESVQHMTEVLEELPDVDAITGGDEEHPIFSYKPFHEKPEAAGTVWWRGRTYRDALEAEKDASRKAVEAEQSTHKEEVQRLQQMWQQEKASLRTQLHKVQREHQQLLGTLKETTEESELSLQDAQKKIAVLNSKLASTEETASHLIIDDVKGVLANTESTLNADVLTAALSDVTAATFLAQELSSRRDKSELERKLVAFVRQYAIAVRACQGSLSELTTEDAAQCQENLQLVASSMDAFVADAHTQLSNMSKEEEDSYASVSEANVDSVCSNLSKLYKLLEAAVQERKNVPAQLTQKVSRAQEAVRDAISSMQDLEPLVSNDDPQVEQRNQAILDAATAVLESVQTLIFTVIELKKLVARNKDDTGLGVLRVHRWFGALETVVNAVLSNLPVWLECLRRFLTDGSQFERLQVAVRGLAACSAQLIALIQTTRAFEDQTTRDTMERVVSDSRSLTARSHDLIDALRAVKNVSLARSMIEDPSNMKDVQVKRLVMDSQVEVLRLEQALDDEREKLAQLRRAIAERGEDSHSSSSAHEDPL